jgi:predicted ribosome quality control (RQC) complex YloA/Tae2 family protein
MKQENIEINNIIINFNIGSNACENYELLYNSKPNDLWFHLDEYPSCYVIASTHDLICNKKDKQKLIKFGCVLCKKYSKYASIKNIKIIYTQVKNLEKTKYIGSVIAKNTKIISL